MPGITIKEFSGRAPRVAAHALAPSLAQVASNCKLWSRELRAFKGLAAVDTIAKVGLLSTIYSYEDTWLGWTQDVSVAEVAVASDATKRFVFIGTDKPRITNNFVFDDPSPGTSLPPASYILGISKPPATPTVAVNGAGVLTGAYVWVYTYVRKWSDGTTDEGPPSTPSAVLNPASQKVDVTMSNAGAPVFADYGITHKRIYRSLSGVAGATFNFVAEVTVATTLYQDNIADTALGEQIESTLYLAPPDGATGAIFLQNGVTAMFNGNVLYLSEPYRAHAYPLANQYTVNFDIVGLGHFGTTVVVCTKGMPWAYYGADPAAMTPARYPHIQPCMSRRSIVSDEFAVRYASPNGIVQVGQNGLDLVTRELFTKDEWAAYKPDTIHAYSFDGGRYMGFYKTGIDDLGHYTGAGFVFDNREGLSAFSDLDFYAYAGFTIKETGLLYLLLLDAANGDANTVYQWEGGTLNALPYKWRSKRFIMPSDDNLAYAAIIGSYDEGITPEEAAARQAAIDAIVAANDALLGEEMDSALDGSQLDEAVQLDGDTFLSDVPETEVSALVTFNLYVDKVLRYSRIVRNSDMFPLPAGYTGASVEIEVSGQVPITEISVVGDGEELAGI